MFDWMFNSMILFFVFFVVHVEVTVDEADIFFKEETWPEYARPATCVAIALTALVALYNLCCYF